VTWVKLIRDSVLAAILEAMMGERLSKNYFFGTFSSRGSKGHKKTDFYFPPQNLTGIPQNQ